MYLLSLETSGAKMEVALDPVVIDGVIDGVGVGNADGWENGSWEVGSRYGEDGGS